jgi:hypothetical protein
MKDMDPRRLAMRILDIGGTLILGSIAVVGITALLVIRLGGLVHAIFVGPIFLALLFIYLCFSYFRRIFLHGHLGVRLVQSVGLALAGIALCIPLCLWLAGMLLSDYHYGPGP